LRLIIPHVDSRLRHRLAEFIDFLRFGAGAGKVGIEGNWVWLTDSLQY